jgi:hypothetical protein
MPESANSSFDPFSQRMLSLSSIARVRRGATSIASPGDERKTPPKPVTGTSKPATVALPAREINLGGVLRNDRRPVSCQLVDRIVDAYP